MICEVLVSHFSLDDDAEDYWNPSSNFSVISGQHIQNYDRFYVGENHGRGDDEKESLCRGQDPSMTGTGSFHFGVRIFPYWDQDPPLL